MFLYCGFIYIYLHIAMYTVPNQLTFQVVTDDVFVQCIHNATALLCHLIITGNVDTFSKLWELRWEIKRYP